MLIWFYKVRLLSSKSATFLVIFIVAIIAFCLACVCASMTGEISILPNGNESGGVLDNLSAITDGTGDTGESYGSSDYDDYSSSGSDSSYQESNVETTVDNSHSSNHDNSESSNSNNDNTQHDSGGKQPGSNEPSESGKDYQGE